MTKKLSQVYQDCIDDIDAGKWTKGAEIIYQSNGETCHCARGLIIKNSGSDYSVHVVDNVPQPGGRYGYYDGGLYDPAVMYIHQRRDVFFKEESGFISLNDSRDTTKELIRERFEAIRDVALEEGV